MPDRNAARRRLDPDGVLNLETILAVDAADTRPAPFIAAPAAGRKGAADCRLGAGVRYARWR
jgi:hypothetical protein